MKCIEAHSRIHAYMDSELDLLSALAVEAHLLACGACSQMHAQHAAARRMLRGHATSFAAPPALRAQLRNLTAPADRRAARPWRSGFPVTASTWPSFGAAMAFAIVTTWTVFTHFSIDAAAEHLPEEIVSSHVRALVSNQPADIVSADPQQIKPWLDERLGYSPRVDDLARDGYSLVGSRIDYVREHRVAALVYRHLGRPIDVYVWPASARDAPPRALSRRGYNLVNWTDDGMFFCAVSDLDHAELATLARLLQRDAG